MENNTTKSEQKLSTPVAIILAGALIMGGILLTRNSSGGLPMAKTVKTPSEQLGISKTDLAACIKSIDVNALGDSITKSVEAAMKALPNDQRGTPYSIVIGKGGVMTDIRGADDYAGVKAIVDNALAGKVTTPYKGAVVPSEPTDHVQGNPNAVVTIIEYSDFECPYCKRFHPVMEQVMKDYAGQVKWIYRQFPLHQHSFEKLVAAECVAKHKGDDAYFKYADLLFSMLNTGDTAAPSISDQL